MSRPRHMGPHLSVCKLTCTCTIGGLKCPTCRAATEER